MVKDAEERLTDQLEILAQEIVDSIGPADIEKASLRDRVVAAGILIDKKRLIKGQATSHVALIAKCAADALEELIGPDIQL